MKNSVYVANKLILLNNSKFNDSSIVTMNGLEMQKGQFCLYKTMYLSNIFFLLINGEILMPKEEWQAWTNGPVNIAARDYFFNYNFSTNDDKFVKHNLNNELINKFLKDINDFFSDLDENELYEISHEDESYKKTKKNSYIDIQQNLNYYNTQYSDAIKFFSEKYGWSI